ncbi:unnamed protein product [Candidula unifasciata]|uniref:Uncharacterized protein n=1 Tax=Candidula unifasciata TaxID=100452 RepID=A0A8S3ZHZ7_9EUPU|nr:unnamed protein product [Candidula unifasciata]
MVKHTTFVVAFLVVYINSWLPQGTSFVSVLASPATEEAQSILSSLSEANSQQATKGVFYPSKVREEIELAQALEDYLPRPADDDDDEDLYYSDGGDVDKRRLRASKRRLRGSKRSFRYDKRRLRFVKRNDYSSDQDTGLLPRLRFHAGQSLEKK